MKKTLFVVLILSLLLGGAVFAGGSQEDSSATGDAEQVHLRFSWWGGDVRHKATLAALDQFMEENPNITIEGEYGAFGSFYQKLLTQLSGGTAPDVFFVDYKWVFDLLSQNKDWFVNMNTMTDQIDMSGLNLEFARSWASMDNFLIGLPVGLNAIGLVYNKDLTQKAGIRIDDQWDWDDVLEAGRKMKAYDQSKYAVFFNQPFYMYLFKVQLKQMTGNDVLKPDYTLGVTEQQVAQVFAYIKELVDTGTVPPFEEHVPYEKIFADQNPGWLNQDYAISFTSSSHIPTIQGASDFQLGVARYPIMEDAVNPGLITAPTQMITLNNKSPHLEEAVKFVNFFLNDEDAIRILADTRGLPAVQKARDILTEEKVMNPLITKLVETSIPFTGGPEGAASQNQEVVTLINDYIHMIGYERLTPNEAASEFIKDLKDLAAELKK